MLTTLLCLLLAVACLYQYSTFLLVRRFHRYELAPPCRWRPELSVSHLKTISGIKHRTEECLRSYVEQEYAGPVQVVFSAGRIGDAALPLVRAIATDDPRVVVVEGDAHELAANPKVASTIQAYPSCKFATILSSDSDQNAPPDYLNKVMSCFEDPQVGVVTTLYCIQRVATPAMALEALSVLDFNASVLVARALEGMSFGLGANMAFRREALEQIGGFSSTREYLAEDYQLANRIHKNGWKVKLAGTVTEDVLGPLRFQDYFQHQLRWMRTYRVSRPGGHAAFLVTQGLLWALLLMATRGYNLATASAFLVWWFVRGRCAVANWKMLGGQDCERWVALLPAKDLIYLILWCASWVGDRIRWGDRELKLLRDGRMKVLEIERAAE